MEIIKLNLIPSGVNPTCHAKQYDKGRIIRFELFNGLTPYTLQSGDTVTLNLRKPDNTIIESSVTATQGNKYVDLVTTEQMCAVAGYNLGTFKIVNGETDIGTLDFIMEVGKDVLANGIPSQSVIEDLDELVAEAVEADIGDNYYNKTQTNALLNGKADKSTTVSKVDAPSYNLFNGEFSEVNGYYNGSGIVEVSNYKMTKPIFLASGNYYYNLITLSYGGVAPYFARTNQTGTTFTRMTATATGDTLTVDNKTYDIYGFTITEPDYYLFNANTGATATASSAYFMITNQINGIPEQYVPYQEIKKFESGISLSDDMIKEILGLHKLNPLYKESLSADGDSICYGVGYLGGYAKIISDNNSMQYENLAVGGATITAETYSSGETPRHWICRSMQNLSVNADYIIIEGGVNDASLGVTLGSLSSGYNATLDDTTFYGAIETIFKTLVTKYVGKKYGFIIPHRMSSGMYPNGNYYNAIVESGAKWGVKILDLTQSVPPFNNFRNNDTYDAIREEYTTSGDGWHPTELCYNKYYVPQIESWLKTL